MTNDLVANIFKNALEEAKGEKISLDEVRKYLDDYPQQELLSLIENELRKYEGYNDYIVNAFDI